MRQQRLVAKQLREYRVSCFHFCPLSFYKAADSRHHIDKNMGDVVPMCSVTSEMCVYRHHFPYIIFTIHVSCQILEFYCRKWDDQSEYIVDSLSWRYVAPPVDCFHCFTHVVGRNVD